MAITPVVHPGYLPRTNISPARIKEIRYAVNGYAFNHATQSGSFGIRMPASMVIEPVTNNDAFGRPLPNTYKVTITQTTFQPTLATIRNAYLLSREPFQLYVRAHSVGADQYYSFTENTGDPLSTPNGTALVGLNFKFTCDKDKRVMELTYTTMLSTEEYEYLLSNTGAPVVSSAGTNSMGLVDQEYDSADYTIGNFANIQIENSAGTAFAGAIADPVFEFESTSLEDQYGRPLGNRKVSLNCSFTALQNNPGSDLLAFLTDMTEDITITYFARFGDVFILNSGAGQLLNTLTIGDEERNNKITIKGEIPYNSVEATPNAIDLGITNADEAVFNLISAL